MMYGYKMKMFGLSLMFFLLGILCIFTLGIGFLWLYPYMQVTMAKFYEDIKGGVQPESPKAEPVSSTESAKENAEPVAAEPVSKATPEATVESKPEVPAETQENNQNAEVATEPAK
jgi:cytoskeletal protein RodZ